MDDLHALIERREQIKAAKGSMHAYREFINEGHHPDFMYEPAPHHELIMGEIEDLIEKDDYDVLLIMAPPGSAKSTYASVQAPTWIWAKYPMMKILACSNTTTMAEDFARRRRSVCEMEQWQILSDTELDPAQINIGGFANKLGGVMYARGAGSSIAGLRCNLLLSDDLISSFEEANSPGQLDKLWEWYGTDARTRLVPDGKEIMIMTRWSRQDPIGRILERLENGEEPKRVKILRLPMLCDDPINDPMGREMSEPLWPEWFSNAQIADNINHPVRWPALYQQVPVDASGTWVDEQYFQFVEPKEVPDNCKTLLALDLALSQSQGDWTVIVAVKIDTDRNLYVCDLWRDQVQVGKTLNKLSAMYKQYKPPYVLIDDDPAAKVFTDAMKEFARNQGEPVQLRKLPIAGRDKEYRAAPLRDLFMQLRIHIVKASWNQYLVHEAMTFPPKSKTEHDDIIDALGLVGRDVWTQTVPQEERAEVVEPIEGAYIERDGQRYTKQTMDEMWDKPKSHRFETLRL